jgi:hypothetical protein
MGRDTFTLGLSDSDSDSILVEDFNIQPTVEEDSQGVEGSDNEEELLSQ